MLYVIKNAEAINAGKAKPEEIGARAIDPQTLEITLNAPTPYFLEMLTHQAAYPVHRATVETVRRGMDEARQSRLERRFHARRMGAERSREDRQEPEIP